MPNVWYARGRRSSIRTFVRHLAAAVACRPNPKDIDLRLQALAQRQVVGADLEPACRLLVEVQAAADLDHPARIEADLAVVHGLVERDLQHDVELQQALG